MFLLYFETGFYCVDQGSLELTDTGIKGVRHQAQPASRIYDSYEDTEKAVKITPCYYLMFNPGTFKKVSRRSQKFKGFCILGKGYNYRLAFTILLLQPTLKSQHLLNFRQALNSALVNPSVRHVYRCVHTCVGTRGSFKTCPRCFLR